MNPADPPGPEQLRQGLRDTRARVDRTIDEIEQRLRPNRVAQRATAAATAQGRRLAAAARREVHLAPDTLGRAAGRAVNAMERAGAGRVVSAATGAIAMLVAGRWALGRRAHRRP